jgi:chromosome segregation ATPase
METKFTGSNYYKRSLTEYEVEACKRDAAKLAQGCNECSLTSKIDRRAELDAEIPALEAEIAAATEAKTKRSAELDAEITALMVEIAAAKTTRNHKLAAMDAEIAALEAELAASKTKPNAV